METREKRSCRDDSARVELMHMSLLRESRADAWRVEGAVRRWADVQNRCTRVQ